MSQSKRISLILLFTIIYLSLFSNFSIAAEKGGIFESVVAKPINNISETLGKWLGLNSFRELVFNERVDTKSGKAVPRTDLNWGIIGKKQTKTLVKAHYFFFFWSIFIFTAAASTMWLKKAASVTIPAIRSSLKMSLIYFFLSFSVVFLLIPLFALGAELTQIGVNIFNNDVIKTYFDGSLATDNSILSDLTAGFVRLVMIGLTIYLNFIYIVRKNVLLLLFVSSPVIVPLINFDSTRKGAITFFKEILSQLFIPVIHAFMFWFFALVAPEASNLEKIVLLFTFVPLADFFRVTLLGDSKMSRLGGMLGLATIGTLGAAALKGYGSTKKNFAPQDVGKGRAQYEQTQSTSVGSGPGSNGGSSGGSGTRTSIGHNVRNAIVETAKTGVKTVGAAIGAGAMSGAGPGGAVAGATAGYKATGAVIDKVSAAGSMAAAAGKGIISKISPSSPTNNVSEGPSLRETRSNAVLTGRYNNFVNSQTEYQQASDQYGSDSIQALAAKQRLDKNEVKYNRAVDKYEPSYNNDSSRGGSMPGKNIVIDQNAPVTKGNSKNVGSKTRANPIHNSTSNAGPIKNTHKNVPGPGRRTPAVNHNERRGNFDNGDNGRVILGLK